MANLCDGFRMLQLCSSSLDGLVNSISRCTAVMPLPLKDIVSVAGVCLLMQQAPA